METAHIQFLNGVIDRISLVFEDEFLIIFLDTVKHGVQTVVECQQDTEGNRRSIEKQQGEVFLCDLKYDDFVRKSDDCGRTRFAL